jgi:hypothetical protein
MKPTCSLVKVKAKSSCSQVEARLWSCHGRVIAVEIPRGLVCFEIQKNNTLKKTIQAREAVPPEPAC